MSNDTEKSSWEAGQCPLDLETNWLLVERGDGEMLDSLGQRREPGVRKELSYEWRATRQSLQGQEKISYFNGIGLSSFRALEKEPFGEEGTTLKEEDWKWLGRCARKRQGVLRNSLSPLEGRGCHYRQVYRSWGQERLFIKFFKVQGPLLVERNPHQYANLVLCPVYYPSESTEELILL